MVVRRQRVNNNRFIKNGDRVSDVYHAQGKLRCVRNLVEDS